MTVPKNRILGLICVAGIALAAGCAEEDRKAGRPAELAFTSGPDLAAAPNPELVPLVRILTLSTSSETKVSVSTRESGRQGVIASRDGTTMATDHELTVLGFHAGVENIVKVTVTDAEGNTLTENITVDMPPIPSYFPAFNVTIQDPEQMAPGVTLFDLTGSGGNADLLGGSAAGGGALIAIDAAGQVVWYYEVEDGIADARRLSNGKLMFIEGGNELIEMDMLGNVVTRWMPAETAAGNRIEGSVLVDGILAFHHEAFEMPNGNIAALGVAIHDGVADYPLSEWDPTAGTETADTVISDVIVEFRWDGTVVNTYDLFDILDPTRVGYNSRWASWDTRLGHTAIEIVDSKDWTHGNAVIYDLDSNAFIVSSRHQDAVIKFSRATGELIWVLGTPSNWDTDAYKVLAGYVDSAEYDQCLLDGNCNQVLPFAWFYHQHAPQLLPSGNILLYDNGNFRAAGLEAWGAVAPDNHSRAMEFAIDEDLMTAELVWESDGGQSIYTPFIGDADYQEVSDTVLITFGGITHDVTDPGDPVPTDTLLGDNIKLSAKLIEVTRATPSVAVWEMTIDDPSPGADGWRIYRSERLPGIYP